MPGCFFFFTGYASLAFQSRCSLCKRRRNYISNNLSLSGVCRVISLFEGNGEARWWNGNAPLNLTFDRVCNACISTSVFILREKFEPSCARFHALYKHFDFVFSKSTLKGLGLGNHYSASQKMKWNVTNCYIFTRRGRQRQRILSRSMWAGLSFYLKDYIPIPLTNKPFDLKTRRTVLDRISPISLTGVCIF